MMKKLFSIILIASLFGCSLQKKCDRWERKCAKDSSYTETNVVYKKYIEYRDTIILYTLPNEIDTVFQDKVKYVYLARGLITSDTSLVQNEYCTSKAWVFDSRLKHYITIKDTTIQIRLDSVIKRSNYYEEKAYKKVETNRIEVKFIPAFYKFTFWGFWILLLIIAFYLLIKTYQNRIETLWGRLR